jgi:hypothetical protein
LTFDSLNAHWPDDSVLSMKGAAGIVSVRLFTSNPTLALMTEVRALVKSRPYSGSSITFRAATWGEGPAVEFHGPGEAGVAARSDDQLWMVVANGADADRLLERLLPGIAIHDLAAPCSAQACGL